MTRQLTQLARAATQLPSSLHQALIGQLLSDGFASKSSPTSNTRIEWSFGSNYKTYGTFIATLFDPYCNIGLRDVLVRWKGNIYTNYRLKTATLPVFNMYHQLFYKLNDAGRYVKIVPQEIISLMTPIVLAHLMMGDGNFDPTRSQIRIFCNSFTKSDVELLAAAISQLGLKTIVKWDRPGNNKAGQWMVTIPSTEFEALRTMVVPHTCPSMLYRLGL